jgi:hypothetical protein
MARLGAWAESGTDEPSRPAIRYLIYVFLIAVPVARPCAAGFRPVRNCLSLVSRSAAAHDVKEGHEVSLTG